MLLPDNLYRLTHVALQDGPQVRFQDVPSNRALATQDKMVGDMRIH